MSDPKFNQILYSSLQIKKNIIAADTINVIKLIRNNI